ncbi:MAG: RNA polymerase sigma factor [Burkholderiales bacterium]|nr:RNA polymerase sigma factor [Burkholderiales bacterium]
MPVEPRVVPKPPSAGTSEEELAALAAGGDGAAFEALMRRHNRLLFRTARSILKDDAAAEDAVQEAYLRAWRALGEFRAQSKVSTWLVRIVANEALGRLRRRGAEVIPLEAAMTASDPDTQEALTEAPDRGPEQIAMRAQVRRLLEAHIDLLPEIYRTIFMLRAVEELSVEEVAQVLDIPEATVRTRFFRARGLLREGLAQQVDVGLDDVFAFDGARCDRIVANVLAQAKAEGLSEPA